MQSSWFYRTWPVLLVISLINCGGPQKEVRTGAFVFGWTGIETTTSNVYDPYLPKMLRGSCPGTGVAGVQCVGFFMGGGVDQNNNPVFIFTAQRGVDNPQQDANEFATAMGAPRGCPLTRTQPAKSPIGYTYGYAACGLKDGYYSAVIVSNKWGHAYFVVTQSLGVVPMETDLEELLESIRFPA